MIVGERGVLDTLAGAVVVQDGCGQGKDAQKDAGDGTGWCVAAVALEVELAFERVSQGLGELGNRAAQVRPCGRAAARSCPIRACRQDRCGPFGEAVDARVVTDTLAGAGGLGAP